MYDGPMFYAAPPHRFGTDDALRALRAPRTLIVMACAIVVIASLVALGAGVAASDASERRARTQVLHRERLELQERARDAIAVRDDIARLRSELTAKFGAFGVALDRVLTTQNRWADIANAAIARFNAGDVAGSAQIFRGDGGAALADMQINVEELHQAVQELRAARAALEEEL